MSSLLELDEGTLHEEIPTTPSYEGDEFEEIPTSAFYRGILFVETPTIPLWRVFHCEGTLASALVHPCPCCPNHCHIPFRSQEVAPSTNFVLSIFKKKK